MFVSLDKITIPVAEEFNVRTGKAQEITSQGPLSGICLTNDHLWGHPNLRSGIIYFFCCCCCCFFGLRGKKVMPDTFI